jgi:hypothetical protein
MDGDAGIAVKRKAMDAGSLGNGRDSVESGARAPGQDTGSICHLESTMATGNRGLVASDRGKTDGGRFDLRTMHVCKSAVPEAPCRRAMPGTCSNIGDNASAFVIQFKWPQDWK